LSDPLKLSNFDGFVLGSINQNSILRRAQLDEMCPYIPNTAFRSLFVTTNRVTSQFAIMRRAYTESVRLCQRKVHVLKFGRHKYHTSVETMMLVCGAGSASKASLYSEQICARTRRFQQSFSMNQRRLPTHYSNCIMSWCNIRFRPVPNVFLRYRG
jgi:hypothetical protein